MPSFTIAKSTHILVSVGFCGDLTMVFMGGVKPTFTSLYLVDRLSYIIHNIYIYITLGSSTGFTHMIDGDYS